MTSEGLPHELVGTRGSQEPNERRRKQEISQDFPKRYQRERYGLRKLFAISNQNGEHDREDCEENTVDTAATIRRAVLPDGRIVKAWSRFLDDWDEAARAVPSEAQVCQQTVVTTRQFLFERRHPHDTSRRPILFRF
jgi:hypothetical protein